MSGSSLIKHSKGSQAQETGQNAVFLTALLGFCIAVEVNFLADSKLMLSNWCAICTLIFLRFIFCHCKSHPQMHTLYTIESPHFTLRIKKKALQSDEFWGKELYHPDT